MIISRTDKIASIIEKRQPLAIRIEEVENSLRDLLLALNELDRHRNQLLSQADDVEIRGRLGKISFTVIQKDINDELSKLSKLKTRCSRKTLNIGVVGRAGQGKSRLLQSLSGLSTQEIPSGDGSHCTGVRSTIHHTLGVETYGEVWFHSEYFFLNKVIKPYYEKLELGNIPSTLEEFEARPLPKPPELLLKQATFKSIYEHLGKYHTNFNKYKHLLKETSPYRISKQKIREYVAQDNLDREQIHFNYLAVQKAEIFCTFPNSDVGQIALIDMPGLGDTGIGDAERLVNVLGQEVDTILFVRMPKAPREYWADVDVQLYDMASFSLVELPIHLWSFMVLNQTVATSPMGDNSAYAEVLAKGCESSGINVIECINANCADEEEANQKVLERVLDYLMQNITALDRDYVFSCENRLNRLHSDTKIELEKAKKALGYGRQRENWFPIFNKLFNKLWSDLTVGLEELLRSLRTQRDTEDPDFENQVKTALQKCRQDTGIPSIQEIEIRRDSEGSYNIAYNKYLHEIRAHLSQHFLSLDNGLKQSLEKLKSQVVDRLVEKGGLQDLTEIRGTGFLYAVEDLIPENLGNLKLGFHILSTFELSYRGLIQHRIRQHLDRLTPDETPLHLSQTPSAKEILVSLENLHAEAIYECEIALGELLREPSQAAYAIVEEFVDRVLRAEGVKDDWQIFLEEIRSEVWSSEFKNLEENSQLRREWLNSVELAFSTNQLDLLKF